jgi:hypothetical protein
MENSPALTDCCSTGNTKSARVTNININICRGDIANPDLFDMQRVTNYCKNGTGIAFIPAGKGSTSKKRI